MAVEIFNNGLYKVDYVEGTVIDYEERVDTNKSVFILEKDSKNEVSINLTRWNIPLRKGH